MRIDNIGSFHIHEDIDEWFVSEPLSILPLADKRYRFVVHYYSEEIDRILKTAMENFKHLSPAEFQKSSEYIYQYYMDTEKRLQTDQIGFLNIDSHTDVWEHISTSDEIVVSVENIDDPYAYITLECQCDWEPEHRLQIVFRNGNQLAKVGQYDGHLTNEHAYAREEFRNKIYVRIHDL